MNEAIEKNIEDNYDICRACKKFLPKKEMESQTIFNNDYKMVFDENYRICKKCLKKINNDSVKWWNENKR